eukprot:SM000073S21436  [mRNA]  locus=s73:235202:236287:- [translate_table: standard]
MARGRNPASVAPDRDHNDTLPTTASNGPQATPITRDSRDLRLHAQQLASDKFKEMVCGEIVAVQMKHAVPETVKWQTNASMHENTDYVHMILTLGPGDNMWYDKVSGSRKVMYFFQQPGHSLWMKELKKF